LLAIFQNSDDPLRTCTSASSRCHLISGGDVQLIDGDVTFFIQRVMFRGHGVASRVSDAFSLVDANFHIAIPAVDDAMVGAGMLIVPRSRHTLTKLSEGIRMLTLGSIAITSAESSVSRQ
jgi:hypothetical protein